MDSDLTGRHEGRQMTMTDEEIQALQAKVQEALRDYDEADQMGVSWVALDAADRMQDALAAVPALCADLLAARAEIARLRGVLGPFAEAANVLNYVTSDDISLCAIQALGLPSVGDLRRARAALEGGK